jgi:DNA-binding PadR family transcriptional regulator
MSIRFAILGLLAEAPLHGYAVHAAFEERLGEFWELNYGQVYQVLTALERQGLVVATDEQVGRRPTRKVYALSAKGRDAFGSWLAHGAPRSKPFRDDLFLRLLFAGNASPARLASLIDAQLQAAQEQRSQLASRRRAACAGTGEPFSAIVRRLYVEAALLQVDARVRALELCRATLGLRAPAGRGPR